MKRVILLLLVFGLGLTASAQQARRTTSLQGTVIDATTGSPMPGATIIASETKSALADAKGTFTINEIPRDTINVQILFMGYETVNQKVILNQNTVNMGTIRMAEKIEELAAAVAIGEAKEMVMKGDTLQFNAAAHKTNPDADGSDLAEKMGFEVGEDGKSMKIHGDTIKRAYVDGSFFMGEEAMAVLSALPADLIDAMQIFDELPDADRFSGFNSGQTQRALNVVTKARGGIKKSVNIMLPVGYGFDTQKQVDGGYQSLYNITPTMQYNAEKVKINLTGVASNVGNSFGGSGRRGAMGGGRMGGGGLSTNYGANFGISRIWDRDNSVTLNYTYGRNENENKTKSIRYWDPTTEFATRQTLDSVKSNSTSQSHRISLNGKYTKGKNMLNLRSTVSFNNGDSWNDSYDDDYRDSVLYTRTTNTNDGTNKSYSISNQFDWVLKIGEKAGRTLNISANMSVNNNESDSKSVQEQYKNIQGVETTTNKDILTTNDSPSSSYTAGVSYNEPLATNLMLNLNYSLSYSDNDRENIRKDILSLSPDSLDPTSQINYSKQWVNSGRIALTYSKPNQFSTALGLSFRGVNHDMDYVFPESRKENQKYESFVPTFRFNYYITRQKSLTFTYATQERVPSISQKTDIITVGTNNTLRLTSGNPDLDRQYTHNFNLRYNTTNIEKNTNFNATVRGSVTQNSILNKTIYILQDSVLADYNDYLAPAGSELRVPVNENGNFSINADAQYSFRVLRQQVRLSANYQHSETPQYTQDVLYKTTNNNGNFGVSVSSNIENVDFSISSRTGFGVNESTSGTIRRNLSENVSGNLNLMFLQRRISLNTNYSLRYMKNWGTNVDNTTTTNTWSAYIAYRFLPRRNADFRIEVNDILNQTPNYTYTVSTEYATERWTTVRGRYVMFRFQYRFNSLQNLANRFGQQTSRNAAPQGESTDGGEQRFQMERTRSEGGERMGRGSYGGGEGMGRGGYGGGGF